MDPHLIRRSRPVNSDSFCVSAYLPSRCTACPVVSFCHSGQCIHRLTYLDDSSTSAVSQLKTFAYPFSQPIRIPMKKNFTKRRRRNFSVRSKIGECRTWSGSRWYSAQFTQKIQGTVESCFTGYLQHALGRGLTQMSVRFGKSTVGLHKCFKLTAAFAARIAGSSPGLTHQGFSALMRSWRCECLIASRMDLSSTLFFVLSPALPSAVSIPSFSPLFTSRVSM